MHELSITQSIVESVAEKVGDRQVTCVRLEIGKLSGVVVESIRFCFDLVADGTPLQGARLEITEPSGRARCRSCGHAFDTDDPVVLCPSCGDADVEVSSGRDLRVLSVQVRTPACADRTASDRRAGAIRAAWGAEDAVMPPEAGPAARARRPAAGR